MNRVAMDADTVLRVAAQLLLTAGGKVGQSESIL